jgi:hypothetical protein
MPFEKPKRAHHPRCWPAPLRTVRWSIALSRDEVGIIADAALRAGRRPGVWGREQLLRAAISGTFHVEHRPPKS